MIENKIPIHQARTGTWCRPGQSQGRQRAVRYGVLVAAVRQAGCASGHPAPDRAAPPSARATSPAAVPHLGHADPASVSAFFIAWASQRATAVWQGMRRSQLASLVQEHAVTRLAGVPAPAPPSAYLSVYAAQVIVTAAGTTTGGSGVALRPPRPGRRRLAGAVLSC